jgi:hypothetical protein
VVGGNGRDAIRCRLSARNSKRVPLYASRELSSPTSAFKQHHTISTDFKMAQDATEYLAIHVLNEQQLVCLPRAPDLAIADVDRSPIAP